MVGIHDDPNSVPATPDELIDRDGMGSPGSPSSINSSEASTPLETPNEINSEAPKRMPSLRSVSDPQNPGHPMSASSTHLGVLSNARRPGAATHMSSGRLPEDLNAKMRAFHLSRQGSSPLNSQQATPPSGPSPGGPVIAGLPGRLQMPGGIQRPGAPSFPKSAPSVPSMPPAGGGLAGKRRFGFKLGDMGGAPPASPVSGGVNAGPQAMPVQNGNAHMSQMKQFEEYIDSEKGYLTFKGKAIITNKGVTSRTGPCLEYRLTK